MKTTRMVLLVVLLALPATVHGQGVDAGTILGQTPATGGATDLVETRDEARKDLGQAARLNERGVFLVGSPKVGTGTAWVISKKHRLLVTNAHVADIRHEAGGTLLAIPNGTGLVYTVEKIWYHPGVRRYFKGVMSVCTMDPQEGEIDPHCPDLAVLQLSGDGPDLPIEFPLATPEEWAARFAARRNLGFPRLRYPKLARLGREGRGNLPRRRRQPAHRFSVQRQRQPPSCSTCNTPWQPGEDSAAHPSSCPADGWGPFTTPPAR